LKIYSLDDSVQLKRSGPRLVFGQHESRLSLKQRGRKFRLIIIRSKKKDSYIFRSSWSS